MPKLTPEQLSQIHYKVAVVDADSLLFKASAEQCYYNLFDEDNNFVGKFNSDRELKDHLNGIEEFLGIDPKTYRKERVVIEKNLEDVIKTYEGMIKRLTKNVSADRWVFYLGQGELDRVNTSTLYKYKGNREGLEKPKWFYPLKDYVISLPDTRVVQGIEVDDMVSMIGYDDFKKNGLSNPRRVILFADKDILNTPMGAMYNYSTEEWISNSEQDADYSFALQMLKGDWSVDGIKGLENCGTVTREKFGLGKRNGCGEASAKKILEDLKGQPLSVLYKRVLACYKDFYGEEYTYKAWTGETLTRSAEEILDENCELLFMQRNKKERWLDYKAKYLEVGL